MAGEGSYSMAQLAEHIDGTLCNAGEKESSQLFQIKKLVTQYRSNQHHLLGAGTFDAICALAKEFRTESLHSSKSKALSLLTPAALRVAIYNANSKAHIDEIKGGVIRISEIPLPKIPKLPSSYGFKGGAARIALAAVLGKDVKARLPRDWDIFRIGIDADPRDSALAETFMPDDYAFGNGVELLPDLRSYFHTRDLTINQVALFDHTVIATYAAVEDTLNGVLRATDYVRDEEGDPQGKITMKMLRLESEAQLEGEKLFLSDYSHNTRVTPFDISLHLERILTRGTRVAQYYIERCIKHGYLKNEAIGKNIGDAIHRLSRPGGSKQRKTLSPINTARRSPFRKVR